MASNLPEYSIAIGNRTYKVELTKKEREGLFEAKVNDKPVELKLETSETGTTPSLALNIEGKTYNVELEKIDRRTPFSLKINNVTFKAQLRESARRIVAQSPIVPTAAKVGRRKSNVPQEGAVVAPMAGKIVSVMVKKGDIVKTGDVVCILEAMKMENEIAAMKDGKVQEVNAAEGTPVNEGDILIIIG